MSRLMTSLFPMHAAMAMEAEAAAKAERVRAALRRPTWRADKPDAELLVLLRLEDTEQPLILGFTDGATWLQADGSPLEPMVLGWMDLNEAAEFLDGRAP